MRIILCEGGCPLGDSAKYCKYCVSGACEANKPEPQRKTPQPFPVSDMYKYTFYGGKPVKRNSYK